mgnify:CR=1 FL=1
MYGLFVMCLVAKGTYHIICGNFDQKKIRLHLMWITIVSIIYILWTLGNVKITGLY